jgi:hypothetical protein
MILFIWTKALAVLDEIELRIFFTVKWGNISKVSHSVRSSDDGAISARARAICNEPHINNFIILLTAEQQGRQAKERATFSPCKALQIIPLRQTTKVIPAVHQAHLFWEDHIRVAETGSKI